TTARDNNLSQNPASTQFGLVIEGMGTSTYLGVSRVFVQGLIVRSLLMSKNKPKFTNLIFDNEPFRNALKSKNRYNYSSNEYGLSGPSELIDRNKDEIANLFLKKNVYSLEKAGNLQKFYGTTTKGLERTESGIVGGGYFFVDSTDPNGGRFVSTNNPPGAAYETSFIQGSITDTIRNYNLERNLYNLAKSVPDLPVSIQAGGKKYVSELGDFNNDGFQDLISRTIGSLKGVLSVGNQSSSVTDPGTIAREGRYLKGGEPENIVRPDIDPSQIGSAEAMMAKVGKTAGNPFDEAEFRAGQRGVKRIINVIKNSDASNFALNYDTQNATKFVIGTNSDGTDRVSRQRFSLRNQYAPKGAGKIIFSIKNYSSNDLMFFPPYIQSFQNSDNANWNSINLLGRPEPIYTYNNSTRDGSITFFVLTDYSQDVIIGSDYTQDEVPFVAAGIDKHFTDFKKGFNESIIESLVAKKSKNDTEIAKETDNKNENSGANDETGTETNTENAESSEKINKLKELSNIIADKVGSLQEFAIDPEFSEASNGTFNVYNDTTVSQFENGEIVSKPSDTVSRINDMVSGLRYQPAFFSGDKVDFRRRMDFLAKLTRPSRNESETGFSFINPPICHIQLGDWIHHDVVINSVSVDYTDAPWALDGADGARVQPMWASVSINFNMIGPY
ncbi:MAG TPA: hypothetical protein VLB82_00765, partial [Thermodesulfobacteriota bacterium]|nr:hypothetical protein [Thermodesulfobacteriota bacterium]